MGAYYVSFVNRDVPYTYAVSADELKYEDIFRLSPLIPVGWEF